jgi:pilus assembly protein CpaF
MLVIGEVRSGEDALQAHIGMNTGNKTYLSIHSNSAPDTALRMLQLCGNEEAIAAQLSSNIDLIVFQEKRNRNRVVTEVIELVGFEGVRNPIYNTIFRFVQTGITADNITQGYHEQVNGISDLLAERLRRKQVPEERIRKWQMSDKKDEAPKEANLEKGDEN